MQRLVLLTLAACSLPVSSSAGNGPSFSIVLQTNDTNKSFCLDLFGQSTSVGSPIDIWECTNDQHIFGQTWYFDTGSYKIRSAVNESKCAAINSAGSHNTTGHLVLQDCDKCDYCTFTWDSKTSKINRDPSSDGCLTVDSRNGSFSNGDAVKATNCTDALPWFARVGPPPGPYPKSAVFNFKPLGENSLCLGVSPNTSKLVDGTPLNLYKCSENVSTAQEWIFAAGSYRIRSAADPNMCIDALGMTSGTQLSLWNCNGFPQQQWTFNEAKVSISLSGQADKCMDFGDLRTLKEGAKVVVGNCAGWNLTHSGKAILETVIV